MMDCKCGGYLIIRCGRSVCSGCGAVLSGGPDLIPVPGEFCPNVSSDHPPLCQYKGSSCLKCDNYLDGICDLIPRDVEQMTEDEKDLFVLRKKRDAWYAEIDQIYERIHKLDAPINKLEAKVRKAQGR